MQIQNFGWNSRAVWSYKAILIWKLQLAISYCVILIVVTMTRHIFINIFQTEHSLAVIFDMGYEKNMSFFVIPKSPNVWKKSWKNRTGLL